MLAIITILFKIIHVVLCVGLIFFVLIQSSKGGGLSGAFGGGAETLFGYSDANKKIRKFTTWCAIAFMVTSLTLGILPAQRGSQSSSFTSELPITQAPQNVPGSAPEMPQQNP